MSDYMDQKVTDCVMQAVRGSGSAGYRREGEEFVRLLRTCLQEPVQVIEERERQWAEEGMRLACERATYEQAGKIIEDGFVAPANADIDRIANDPQRIQGLYDHTFAQLMAARRASVHDGACGHHGAPDVYANAANRLIGLRYELEAIDDDALSRMHRWIGDLYYPSPAMVAIGTRHTAFANSGFGLTGFEIVTTFAGAGIGAIVAGPVGAVWGAGISSAVAPSVAMAGLSISLAFEPDTIGEPPEPPFRFGL